MLTGLVLPDILYAEKYFILKSFRYEENQIRFSTDSECNAGAAPILRDRVTYVMEKTPRNYSSTFFCIK